MDCWSIKKKKTCGEQVFNGLEKMTTRHCVYNFKSFELTLGE